MKQHKFIYQVKSISTGDVFDDGNGVICAIIRPGIMLMHDYKNNDQLSVSFKDTNDRYILKDDSQLEEVLRMNLTKINLFQSLHDYCDANMNIVSES